MKKVIYISIFCFALNSGVISQTVKPSAKSSVVKTDNQQKKKVPAKVMYTCPMHPEVLTEKPGKCPKCGMNLVKKEATKKVEPKKK